MAFLHSGVKSRLQLFKFSWSRRVLAVAMCLGVAACMGPPSAKTTDEEFAAIPSFSVDLPDHPAEKLNYIRMGDPQGQPVIFVHGTPGDASVWADMTMSLPDGYDYISIDRPGFGQSGPESSITKIAEHASALEPLLKHSSNKKPILVGHSYGGPVVVQAALDYPDAFSAIIVAAGALDPGLEEIHFMQYVGDSWPISVMLPRPIRNANEELLSLKAELERLEPRLQELTTPTLIVHGTADELVPVANVDYMQAKFPDGNIVYVDLIEGQNHFLPWNSIPQLQKAIDFAASKFGSGDVKE